MNTKTLPNAKGATSAKAAQQSSTDNLPAVTGQAVTKSQGDRVIVNDTYEILFSHAVEAFSHAYADVYEAIQKDNKTQPLLAYVIKGHYTARLDIIQSFLGRETNGMLTIRYAGVATLPDQTQRMVIIINRPHGQSLLSGTLSKRAPVSEEVLRRLVIKPIAQVLNVIAQFGFSHGNIRADNIFWNQRETEEVVIGDFVTMLCGANQACLYETIERAMAHPLAKGEGSSSDDVYALGVLVAVLMRGADPFHDKTDRQILDEKINRSSFIAMTDGLQLTPRMSDFFRATLNDDPRMRWTTEQLESWINGHRAPLKQHSTLKKATRALDFNGQKYLRARLVARDLYDNPTEAVQLIESGSLIKWLDRSLIDPNMMNAVNSAINRANYNGKTGSYEDRLLCYVAMALDPAAPIRYKDVRAMPNGLGGILLEALEDGRSVQSIAEIIREKIAWYKITNDEYPIGDAAEWMKKYDHLSKVILRRSMDCGLERCLYDIAEFAPCISPMFKDLYILNCSQVMTGLDHVGQSKERPATPIDRHIAAFLGSRDTKDNSSHLNLLESDDGRKRSLSLLLLLENLQRRYQTHNLKGLTGWLIKDAETLAQRFHNLKYRQNVIKNLPNEAKSGNLTQLLNAVDNGFEVMQDRARFVQASRYYRDLREEQTKLQIHLQNNTLFGLETGRQIAAVISAILAGIFIVGSFAMRYFDDNGFFS